MQVVIPIFDGITALDAVGPYEILCRVPDWQVSFVASEAGEKRTDTGRLGLIADRSLADTSEADILVVPGGPGNRLLLDDEPTLGWIRQIDATTTWTTSVCTGSLMLGAAGLLRGRRATTHWLSLELLREYGAEPTGQRVVEDGKMITAAGVSAGLDMALHLVGVEAGESIAQSIQLGIEYDPQPRFDAGSPEKAPPEIVEAFRARRSPKQSR